MLQCPSDGSVRGATPTTASHTSYVLCRGDALANDGNLCLRGLFRPDYWHGVASCLDGTSNTIAVSEAVCGMSGERYIKGSLARLATTPAVSTDPITLCANAVLDPSDRKSYLASLTLVLVTRGQRFPDARAFMPHFTTVLPPNSPSCVNSPSMTDNADGVDNWGVYSPSSNHPGGVVVAMADGSSRFVSETINAVSSTLPSGVTVPGQTSSGPSMFGVWGALGTPQGGESVSAP